MVYLLAHHRWEEVAEQADETLDVLFASEEDFFACDGGFPELAQGVALFIIEDGLVEHETLADAVLQVLYLLLRVRGVAARLASRILAVNEQLDGGVLVRLKLAHNLLIESVHIEFLENDSRDESLVKEVELDVLLQVVETLLVALNQHEIEALLCEEVSEDASCFSPRAVDDSRVWLAIAALEFKYFCALPIDLK
eukprot:CAMPEP_0170461272 /NCGR_PEP_ID=MMETSP0123-20130129/7249_1 /TAXON_ID=182087 /ORGANISM="Favella ehrenbergii, Strain Fehren 1" /LENGTH=195 /DNA_ID=CAMNT_0010726269 /DNA_START=430 /DNA_END=1018 /DNA_ORIENTATION=-